MDWHEHVDPWYLIKGGTIVDGSGSAPFAADVLTRGGYILDIVEPGSADQAQSFLPLDVSGLTLSPGFIDVHSHADNAPLLGWDDTSKILQGVTTEVVGNCGFSLAPVRRGCADELERFARRLFPASSFPWSGLAEFLDITDDAGYVTNYAPLVGHGTLRIGALGMSPRPADADDVRALVRQLELALQAGAFGMSSGLVYTPGAYAKPPELSALVAALPENAVYATHMRGEGPTLLQSLRETVDAVGSSSCRLQISHLKAHGKRNWGMVGPALELLDEERQRGVRVTQDVYPYTAGSTTLVACLPPWAQEGGDAATLVRLRDPAVLRDIRASIEDDDGSTWENFIAGSGYEGIQIASAQTHELVGCTLTAIAERLELSAFDALVHVLLENELHVQMLLFSLAESDVQKVLAHPQTMIGSDGLPPGLGGRPHPRQFGTFPRVLARYHRDGGLLSLPEAVRKMTSLPAETFGLRERGLVRAGFAADLVAFDPAVISDRATYESPDERPDGIEWVMVGGDVAVHRSQWLGRRCGIRLERSDA
jgi:N-acyl-D-aspartate/D-glutamate deacylase